MMLPDIYSPFHIRYSVRPYKHSGKYFYSEEDTGQRKTAYIKIRYPYNCGYLIIFYMYLAFLSADTISGISINCITMPITAFAKASVKNNARVKLLPAMP